MRQDVWICGSMELGHKCALRSSSLPRQVPVHGVPALRGQLGLSLLWRHAHPPSSHPDCRSRELPMACTSTAMPQPTC